MNKSRGLVFGLLMILLFIPERVMATVMVGEAARSGEVIVNYTFNHDYFPRDWVYRYQMLADGMEQMRETIYERLKMPKILIIMPDDVFGKRPIENTIEYKSKCQINRGDTVVEPGMWEKDFECFEVNLNTNNPSWEGMIKVLMSLQNFDRKKKLASIRLEDLVSDKTEWYERLAKGFSGFKNYYNGQWSPDSNYVSVIYWQNGKSGVEIIDGEQVKAGYESTDYPAFAPVWLENGNYLVYATLDEVVWWSKATNQFKSVRYEANNLEVLLKYDAKRGDLIIAADTAVLADYVLFKLNLKSGVITKPDTKYNSLGWPEEKGIRKMDYPGQVVSNDGQRKFTYEEGTGNKDDAVKIENLTKLTPAATSVPLKKETNWRSYGWEMGIFAAGLAAGVLAGLKFIRKYNPGE